jgi:cell division protein ZapA
MSDAVVENKVIVNIFGDEYPITATTDTEYIARVADFVDSRMREIAASSRTRAKDKLAILTALSIASELLEKSEDLAGYENKLGSRLQRLVSTLDKTLSETASD